MIPPHTFETLVPEAVLTQYIARREQYGSLIGFNIVSAWRARGVMPSARVVDGQWREKSRVKSGAA